MREGLACRCGRGTLYDVLQVSPWCEPEVIQAAFRALARTRHPDVNRDPDAEEQMRRLNVAYQTLSDPGRRARYDEELALEAARPSTARPSSAPSATTGWATAGTTATGFGARTAPDRSRSAPGDTAGPRPASSGAAGSRPAASAASSSAASVAASASPASAYQATMFETRSDMLLPRSAIYVSLILVTVILALVAWLILDTMAQRPFAPARLPRGYDEMRSVEWMASSWQFALPGASVEPGLSRSDDR